MYVLASSTYQLECTPTSDAYFHELANAPDGENGVDGAHGQDGLHAPDAEDAVDPPQTQHCVGTEEADDGVDRDGGVPGVGSVKRPYGVLAPSRFVADGALLEVGPGGGSLVAGGEQVLDGSGLFVWFHPVGGLFLVSSLIRYIIKKFRRVGILCATLFRSGWNPREQHRSIYILS